MSKEPRAPGTKSSRAAAAAPYPNASRTALPSSTSAAPAASSLPRLTVHNFATFQTRAKKLPPDANTSAATHVRVYQLPDRVCFGCAKCRRDNIQSDSVAVDVRNKVILCTNCFTRIIRPRQYRPSRVVPFPSLLSWLNYKPAMATTVAEDVLERPAEAVAPSGERRSAPMLNRGDRPSAIARLPNIATTIVPTPGGRGGGRGGRGGRGGGAGGSGGGDAGGQKSVSSGKHPCLRVWGVCAHGDLCDFREAPADLCIAYLMGLCGGSHVEAATAAAAHRTGRHRNRRGRGVVSAVAAEDGSRPALPPAPRRQCRLIHQNVFDLPNPTTRSTMPTLRYPGDVDMTAAPENEEAGEVVDEHVRAMRENRRLWQKWLEKRMHSPNSAEWQLWNNGPLRALFDQYVPAAPRPTPPKSIAEPSPPEPQEPVHEEEEEAPPAPVTEVAEPKVKLNLADIQSALRGLQ